MKALLTVCLGCATTDDVLDERISAAIASIQGDSCFAHSEPSACDWADFPVSEAAPASDEAVLVIDSFGEGMFPQLVRYRSRIRGVYHVQGDAIVARDTSVRLPARLGEALRSLEAVPARELGRVSDAAGERYGKLSLIYYGHGGVIFSHLAERAAAPLVLVELQGLLGLPASLCSGEPAAFAAAAAHFAAVADSLQQLIAYHNIHFINASFGGTIETTAADWTRVCGSPPPDATTLRELLQLYAPIYATLFDTPGVLAAHAAANLGAPADFPFDQPRYANRVRVGFFSSRMSGLDASGRGALHAVEQFPRDGDADVYLNWGCEPLAGCADHHYEMAGEFGLGVVTVPAMSTSYITPLGLGRLIDLRSAHPADQMSDPLIQTLRHELTPARCGSDGTHPCVYQDPISTTK